MIDKIKDMLGLNAVTVQNNIVAGDLVVGDLVKSVRGPCYPNGDHIVRTKEAVREHLNKPNICIVARNINIAYDYAKRLGLDPKWRFVRSAMYLRGLASGTPIYVVGERRDIEDLDEITRECRIRNYTLMFINDR